MPPYGSTDDAEYNNLTTAQEAIEIDHDVLQANQPGYGTRNKVEVAFNLVNATVGAGIIGLPFAIYNAGLVFGLVASIFVALISQLGLYMLITAGHRVHIYKYADLVEYLLGRPGFWFLNTTLLFQSIGITISYYICKMHIIIIYHLYPLIILLLSSAWRHHSIRTCTLLSPIFLFEEQINSHLSGFNLFGMQQQQRLVYDLCNITHAMASRCFH